MFLPRHCPGCGRPARTVCDRCRSSFVPETSGGPGLFVYEGELRRVLVAAKNRRQPQLYRVLGTLVADQLVATGRWAPYGDHPWVVTWVPASRSQARDRGFDHGRLLARAVARRLGLRSRRLLRRRPGPPQTGLDRRHRLIGPDLVVGRPVPGYVLVVDDVTTTGSSLDRAQRVLEAAGATAVVTVAVGSVAGHRRLDDHDDPAPLDSRRRRPVARTR